ncbi:MAG: 4-hydroxy-3-methylbut-2-enyl diphosphate reductase [Ruminococcaceae bacterium]|nr:4-hydroxy-3-methylbut-2-enyl diphosphate reductase [Oscillospiraceae bacterium]
MSEVIIAENAGFCPGVRAATERLHARMKARRANERIFTLGHLIHNEEYNAMLAARGVVAVMADDLPQLAAEADEEAPVTVFVRAHGISVQTRGLLEELAAVHPGFSFVDCTCPFVTKIHRIAERYSDGGGEGGYVFIGIGNRSHPEVEGFMSCFAGEKYVFADSGELQAALDDGFLCKFSSKTPIMVAQTTQNLTEWKKCQKLLKKGCTNALIFDTICNVTDSRQTEAAELAAVCDGMIVIGGTESSNTAKLFDICQAICPSTLRVCGASHLPLVKTFSLTHRKVGIVAGASTPREIIEEVYKTMTEAENFAKLLEETEVKNLHTGAIVTGTVSHVSDTELQLDLGAGVTGYIKADRVSDDPAVKLTEQFKVGDTIEAKVIRVSDIEGVAELDKRRVDSGKNWEKVVAAKEAGDVLEATVSEVVKGGVTVFVFGSRVFIPASQTGVAKDGDLSPLKGTNVKFKVIETKDQGHKAIGSIRVVLREERRAQEEEFWGAIEEGKTYTGVVKSMTSYGAFVDLGGVDGMVHTSELSWKHIKSPAEVLAIGDTVTVFVKSFDREKKRISLGYKTEESNPWFIFTNKCQVGDVVPVKIVSMMPFGAFAEIIDGVDGLIHISQIAMTRIGKPADVLEIGQSVDAKIIEIDNEKQKVSLSIRALLEEVAAAEAAMPEDVADEAPVEE